MAAYTGGCEEEEDVASDMTRQSSILGDVTLGGQEDFWKGCSVPFANLRGGIQDIYWELDRTFWFGVYPPFCEHVRKKANLGERWAFGDLTQEKLFPSVQEYESAVAKGRIRDIPTINDMTGTVLGDLLLIEQLSRGAPECKGSVVLQRLIERTRKFIEYLEGRAEGNGEELDGGLSER